MKNSLYNIPFLKPWINYFICLSYKLRSKRLQIGYANEIRNSVFAGYNSLGQGVRLKNASIGTYSYISYDTVIINASVGKFTSVGPRCQIGLGIHPTNLISTHPLFYSSTPPINYSILKDSQFEEFRPISIGNDVWIGANAIILDGITIGDGAIIAAGSVVTKNVEPYAIMKGIPAKKSKYRFSEEKIKMLVAEQWWHEPKSKIEDFVRKNSKNGFES